MSHSPSSSKSQQTAHPRQQAIFGRQEATQVKGVAILLLILHHLFFLPSGNPWFTPLFGGHWGGIEFFSSSVSKICIPLFFFVSGYGLWQASRNDRKLWRSTWKRLRTIYTVYMITVAITVLILSSVTGSWILLSKRHALETFLGLDVTINGSWWFFIVYVELLLLTPFSVMLLRRISWLPVLLLSCLLYLLSPESGVSFFATRIEEMGLGNYFYGAFPIKLFWYNQLFFYTGFCLAAGGIFERFLKGILTRLSSLPVRYIVAILLLTCTCFLRYFLIDIAALFGLISRQGMDIFQYTFITARADFILGPLMILSLTLFFSGKQFSLLRFIGSNSAPIWLIHTSVISLLLLATQPYPLWSPILLLLVTAVSSLYAMFYTWLHKRCHF
jgi:hypothetical protein